MSNPYLIIMYLVGKAYAYECNSASIVISGTISLSENHPKFNFFINLEIYIHNGNVIFQFYIRSIVKYALIYV